MTKPQSAPSKTRKTRFNEQYIRTKSEDSAFENWNPFDKFEIKIATGLDRNVREAAERDICEPDRQRGAVRWAAGARQTGQVWNVSVKGVASAEIAERLGQRWTRGR